MRISEPSYEWKESEFVANNILKFARLNPKTIKHNCEIAEVRETINQQSQENIALLKTNTLEFLAERVTTSDHNIQLPETADHDYKIRIYRPSEQMNETLPVLLYFHTGFWSTGNVDADELGCRAIIANGNNIIIISFEYRLAPENAWNVIFSDAEHAMIWTANNAQSYGGNLTKGFIIGGAVAGAHLAAISAVRARNRHSNINLTGQLLIVPTTIAWTDLETMPKLFTDLVTSHTENSRAPLLTEEDFQRYLAILDIPKEEKRRGENFPVWANLQGLPPTYLAMDGPDPIRDEGYLYEKLLREAGVQTRTDHYEMPNWFVQFPQLPTTGRAGVELATAVRWLLQVGKYTM